MLALPAGGATLREAAGERFQIGCAIASADLDSEALRRLVASQFHCVTPEYELMPEHVLNEERQFTFERADRVVAFARAHDMPVYGHMLIWHCVTRKWLFEDAAGHPLPRAEALKNLEFYINSVVSHYRGRIEAWNVVNECLSDAEGEFLRPTPALKAIGEDYIAKAFAFAHAADPEAKLYFNDYNIEQPGKREKALRLIRDLKAQGVPLHAVGVQGHWLIDGPSPHVIAEGLAEFAASGLEVMITELDVDPLPRTVSGANLEAVAAGPDPYPNGLPPEIQNKLARRYAEIMNVVIAQPAVTLVGFWGTHDGRSWLNNFPVKGRTNHPLLFDRQLQPKPAFQAVLQELNTSAARPGPASFLEILDIKSGKRQAVYRTSKHIEAPNWSRDGSYLLLNGDGKIFKLPVTGGTPEPINITPDIKCNNDHGISPDGTQLVVSGESVPGSGSRIYRLPIEGGRAQQITPLAPSYWHGWSPDGRTLAYCAERQGEFDIYTVRAGGGRETRLTTATGLDDGPEYSPDGRFIYFNSERTGLMQIWRMRPDGSRQEQVTSDDYNNWFAHPSPDGKWIVFLSYEKSVKGHPPGQHVELRLMSLSDASVRVLAKLFGGQGTINVPSWAPDSSKIAFVSYQQIAE